MTKLKAVAIIPARGGSVRVPKKNIKLLAGKPLLAYSIEAAQGCAAIERIVVSTDDPEIGEVAVKYGAEVPFKRPAELSEDVPTEDVCVHAVQWLEENEGYKPDVVVCLEPPQPFRTGQHITDCLKEFYDNTVDSVLTISKVSQRPEWMVRFTDDCLITPYTDCFKKQGEALLRFPASQIFEELYYVNGIVFACRTRVLTRYKSLVGKCCAGVVTRKEDSFSLDWPIDFEICEILMRNRK